MPVKSFTPSAERKNMQRRLLSLGYSSYGSYLNSGVWQTTRRRLARDRCECCSRAGKLHLHHMTYATLGAERVQDVCTLCPPCHHQAHERARQTGSLYIQSVLA